MTTDINIE